MIGVDELLDEIEIEKKLESHDGRIKNLEIQSVRTEEKLNSLNTTVTDIKKGIERIENTMLNTHNSVLNGVNQLLINKDNNKTKIILQVIIIVGGLIGAFFAGGKLVG